MKRAWLLTLPITLVSIIACRGDSPTSPVQAATQPSAPAAPRSPGTTPSLVSDGVYYVSAPITGFDPAWGDWTGYSYGTVLILYHDETNASSLSGIFSDFQMRNAAGQPESWRIAGTITGSVGESGRISLELVSFDRMFSWSATGEMADGNLVGTWGHAHFYGHFVAVHNPPAP
jgi:hypothetical protein